MMKKYGVVLSAALIAGLLVGCGDNKDLSVKTEDVVDVVETSTNESKTTEDVTAREATTTEATTTEVATTEATTEKQTTEKQATEKQTKQTETTKEKISEKKTTEKKKKNSEKKSEKTTTEKVTEQQKSNKDIAKGYIGSPLSSLVSAIGSYSSLVQDEGCIEGYDAIAYYDGFSVMCHSEDQVNWIIVDVY